MMEAETLDMKIKTISQLVMMNIAYTKRIYIHPPIQMSLTICYSIN
jgi:hypothetical protein